MLSVLFQKQDVKNQKERMELLRKLAVQQLQTLEKVSLNNLPKLERDI